MENRRGFTLSEIMLVVTIIGILASISVAAFKHARNRSIEKTLINDARLIQNALGQFCTENAVNQANGAQLSRFFSGGGLSPGIGIGTTATGTGTLDDAGLVLSLDAGASYFYLSHAGYDKSATSSAMIKDAGPTAAGTVIKFSAVTGSPAS